MEDSARLKIKIGVHEFEADGPEALVRSLFEDWRRLVETAPAAMAQPSPQPSFGAGSNGEMPPPPAPRPDVDGSLDKIMKVDGRTVYLTVKPKTADDALLLLLYGQKVLRQAELVGGTEMVEGVNRTGGLGVARPDRLLDKAEKSGDVLVSGERRARRYRMTATGMTKARQLATELLAMVA